MAYPNSLYSDPNEAVWGNVNKIAQSFLPMFDPEVQARAEALRRDRELFPLKRQGLEADINLTRERALTEGAQRGYYGAQTGFTNSKTQGQQIQNTALGQLFQGAQPAPQAQSYGDLTGLPEQLTPLAGAFKQYGDQYGVDPRLLAAISMHETGGGKSNAFINKRNAMGVSDANGPIAFDSPELSVERMARVLANPKGPYAGRNTISGIGQVYAPVGAGNDPGNLNPHWAQGVSQFYQQLGGDPNAQVLRGTGGQIDPQRAAVLASVGGVNPEQLVTGLARAQALSGGPLTEDRGRQIALAQGLLPSQTTTITPDYQNQVLSVNDKADFDKAMAVEGAKGKVDLAKQDLASRYGFAGDVFKGMVDMSKPAGTRGTRQGQGGALSFGNEQDLFKEAADTSMANFGVPMTEDGKGFDTSKDVFGPYRERWASTYSELRQAGADPWTAKSQANLHHFGTSEPASQLDPGGRFFGDPKVKSFNAQPFPADRLRAFGGAQRQPLQGGQLDMGNVAGLLQSLGLAEPSQQQAPSPVAAAIPQTGVPEALRRQPEQPRAPRDFAAENDQRKIAEKQAVGTKYNTEILRQLQQQMQRSGVSLQDLANSAFSTGKKPELALAEALTSGSVPPTGGSISDYMAYTQGAKIPDIEDIQMALRDAAALRALGFDPNQVVPFIPAQFGGQRGIAQPAQQPSNIDALLQKYQ